MYRAEFIRNAFVIAGLGGAFETSSPLLMKYWRSNAHAPLTAGAAWLVPDETVKNF
jgi:hypothetical protein